MIRYIVCLVTGPQPILKRVLHRVWSTATSFKFQYLPFSLRSSSSCLHFLHFLAIPCIFPSITRFKRQFLQKICTIQLNLLHYIVCRMFHSSLALCNTSSFFTKLVQLSFSILLQHHILKLWRYFCCVFQSVQVWGAIAVNNRKKVLPHPPIRIWIKWWVKIIHC